MAEGWPFWHNSASPRSFAAAMNPAAALLLHPVLLQPIEKHGLRLSSALTIVALLLIALSLG